MPQDDDNTGAAANPPNRPIDPPGPPFDPPRPPPHVPPTDPPGKTGPPGRSHGG
jgi:hypothetical protein